MYTITFADGYTVEFLTMERTQFSSKRKGNDPLEKDSRVALFLTFDRTKFGELIPYYDNYTSTSVITLREINEENEITAEVSYNHYSMPLYFGYKQVSVFDETNTQIGTKEVVELVLGELDYKEKGFVSFGQALGVKITGDAMANPIEFIKTIFPPEPADSIEV